MAGALAGPPRFVVWFQTDEGDDVVMEMIGSGIAHRLRCYARVGERVGQGQRYGFIHFPAAVEVLIAPNSRVEVSPGWVRAGSDVLATLVHQ